MTILLPVWRFWPFGVIKTVGNGTTVMSPVVGHGHAGEKMGPRTGGHGVARVDSDHAECGGVSNRINRLRFIGFCHYHTLGPGANMKMKISPAALPADLPKSRGL